MSVLRLDKSYHLHAAFRPRPPSACCRISPALKRHRVSSSSANRMSSVQVNDENSGVIPAGKHSSLCEDIFSLDQPTGRPSILRQTENLPSKTMPKGAKVWIGYNWFLFWIFGCKIIYFFLSLRFRNQVVVPHLLSVFVQVCFQTPRRDPVSKRIMSPSNSSIMSSVDENTNDMESLNLKKSE